MTYPDFSDKSEFAIQNEFLRHTWAAYDIFILLSSLIGDSIIIVSSVKYRAFRLNKFIVVIIQHIAACDLLVSLVSVFPRAVSLIANGWIFGDILKYVAAYGRYNFNAVGLLLICAMTTSKLFILKFPLRSRQLTSRKSQLLCTIMWILPLSLVISGAIVGDTAVFDHRTYDCGLSFSVGTWRWPVLVGLFALVPNFLVIVTTVCLLVIAKKFASRGGKNLKWQGIISTVLVAVVYCVSIFPYILFTFIGYSQAHFAMDPHGFFQTHFQRITKSFVSINIISNFYIYSMTVISFREFLRSSRLNVFKLFTSNTEDTSISLQVQSSDRAVSSVNIKVCFVLSMY